jgi:hypothetical protein
MISSNFVICLKISRGNLNEIILYFNKIINILFSIQYEIIYCQIDITLNYSLLDNPVFAALNFILFNFPEDN